jgi:hypothetical protein
MQEQHMNKLRCKSVLISDHVPIPCICSTSVGLSVRAHATIAQRTVVSSLHRKKSVCMSIP